MSCNVAASGEAVKVSSGTAGLISSDVGGWLLSLAKKTLKNLGIQCFQLHKGVPSFLHQYSGSHSFPINAFTLVVDTLQRLGIQFVLLFSHLQNKILDWIFSNLSSAAYGDKGIVQT